MRDFTYPVIIGTAQLAFKAWGQSFQISGSEHVPREGGVLLAFNHVSYLDFIYGGLAAHPSRRKVRFMAKREVFDHRVGGPVMRSMHHISVDRSEGQGSYLEAVRYLRAGEAVGIFPEATISRALEVKECKSGAVRLAAEAGVPLVPVAIFGTQRMMTKDHPKDFSRGKTIALQVGEPLYPSGEDPAADNAALVSALDRLLMAAIDAYPASEKPPGAWWLPARCGGSAPTLAEAVELDAEEKRQRAARKAQR